MLLLLLLLLMRRRSLLLLLMLLQLHLNLQLLFLLMLMVLTDMQRKLRAFLLKRLIARLAGRVVQSRELGRVEVLRSRVVSEKKGTRSIINTLFYLAIKIHKWHSVLHERLSNSAAITMKANGERSEIVSVLIGERANVSHGCIVS